MSSLNWDAPLGCHRVFLHSGKPQTLAQTMQQLSRMQRAEKIRPALSIAGGNCSNTWRNQ